tara:strand:- start:107627 stop:108088 length:462 start_codon:yes stop_codon:yes gene_type:complete
MKNFNKFNEDVASAPETRLNTFSNFNSLNHDKMGAMEIFAPRVNSEINRIGDEIFDKEDGEEDFSFGDIEGDPETDRDENGDFVETESGFNDTDTGLIVNQDEDDVITPERSLDYPYGMGNNPSPTFGLDNETQSKSNIVFRFADYRGINNFR